MSPCRRIHKDEMRQLRYNAETLNYHEEEPVKYAQLTQEERYQIEALLRARTSVHDIAMVLGRHPSTITREVQRNGSHEGSYRATRAAKRAHERRVGKGLRSRKIQGDLKVIVEQKLRASWSPEQISGRLQLEAGVTISHETIYQHVLRDAHSGGFLRYCLRFGGYKHHRFKKSTVGARTRQRKHWIKDRPNAANERSELGHWERDCVLGQRGGAALLTLVDRRSRYTRIRHVKKVDAATVATETQAALKPHEAVSKSLTNDNGSEFARDEDLQSKLGFNIYFTEPSKPWQRGSIENLNGLVRQYVPKGANLDAAPGWLPAALETTLNQRPRKVLGFRTPSEIFFDQRDRLLINPQVHLGLEFSRPS